jgi:uncharacterized lipoprotein YddW (UPF0748 family)
VAEPEGRGGRAHPDRRGGLSGRLAFAAALLALATVLGCTEPAKREAPVAPPGFPADASGDPPPAPREFRAAWVATVSNIDWPSRRDLTVAQQRAEMIAILERARQLNLNALILQVRPSADAIYPSALEPWSEYLTGEQGRAPQPAWDPLQEWIHEAHGRGIELHAWFNPYRARHSTARSPEAPQHIASRQPALVKRYGSFLWLDPGEAAAAQHTLDVILDVVRRYDIDGVHIDDYFYPYPVQAPGANGAAPDVDFPDEPSWRAYIARGGTLDRASWRRDNVNRLVERIAVQLRREKPWVRFGVSPFGIGRPDRRPPGIAGFSQYDKLYADVELWMRQCWVDYLVPQLYWPIDQAPQAFGVLLDYWLAENTCGRHVFAGLYTSRIDATPQSWAPAEISNQVNLTRRREGAKGHVHFSMAPLAQNRAGIVEALAPGYAVAALPPAFPWIDNEAPPAPDVALSRQPGGVEVRIAPRPGKPAARFAVWARSAGLWHFRVVPATQTSVDLIPVGIDRVVVSAVDRLGNESRRIAVSVP